MSKRKIYLSVKDWWEDKKELINEDLNEAQKHTSDPEIIKLMQELLKDSKVNTEITEYFKIFGGPENEKKETVSRIYK